MLSMMTLSVTACATVSPVPSDPVIDSYCELYTPPRLTEAEWESLSAESERMILDNIAVYVARCEESS
jgi:hypothetical protein